MEFTYVCDLHTFQRKERRQAARNRKFDANVGGPAQQKVGWRLFLLV